MESSSDEIAFSIHTTSVDADGPVCVIVICVHARLFAAIEKARGYPRALRHALQGKL